MLAIFDAAALVGVSVVAVLASIVLAQHLWGGRVAVLFGMARGPAEGERPNRPDVRTGIGAT